MNNMALDIQGMTSGNCIGKVYKALENIEGVSNISVSLRHGQAIMQIDPTLTSSSQVLDAIANIGFKSTNKL